MRLAGLGLVTRDEAPRVGLAPGGWSRLQVGVWAGSGWGQCSVSLGRQHPAAPAVAGVGGWARAEETGRLPAFNPRVCT